MAEKKTRKKKAEKEMPEFVQGFEGGSLRDLKLKSLALNQNDLEFRVSPRLGDLIESIKKNGQQFPILVRPLEGRGYEIVSGYRRVRAIQALGWETVKAIVRDDLARDEDAYRISFLENEKRKSLTGVDKAHAIAKLELTGKSPKMVQFIFGIKERQYERYKKVGKFPDVLKKAISDGKIQTTHGMLLAQAHEQHGDKVDLKGLVEQIAEGELTVRQLARLLNKKKFGRIAKKARYFEAQKGGGFRLYPMRFDPKTTDEATKAKLLGVLKEAVGVIEGATK